VAYALAILSRSWCQSSAEFISERMTDPRSESRLYVECVACSWAMIATLRKRAFVSLGLRSCWRVHKVHEVQFFSGLHPCTLGTLGTSGTPSRGHRPVHGTAMGGPVRCLARPTPPTSWTRCWLGVSTCC